MGSRLSRYQEKILTKRIILFTLGSLALLVFIILFGFKILVGFSLLLDTVRNPGKEKEPATTGQAMLLPPVLDWTEEATNSAGIQISGSGKADLTLIIYVNDVETRKTKLGSDGKFSLYIPLKDGSNAIVAKQTDGSGNSSGYSNELQVSYERAEPNLEIYSPQDGSEVQGETDTITVSGKTDPENQVRINSRLTVVATDGTFNHTYKLSEGENTITVLASDPAGNINQSELKVKYER